MNEKIYTIPVTNALSEDSECAFCLMYASLETSALEFVMGPSYMERDVRDATDRLGFCRDHMGKMLKSKNALGVALMLQTRLLRVTESLDKIEKITKKEAKKKEKNGESCYICQKTQNTFNRYIDTFLYLYERESDVRALVKNGKGFCIPHYAILLERSYSLPSKTREEFVKMISTVQAENLKRLQDEIDWFTKKFDYRFENEPWGTAKDSPHRLALKLTSYRNEEKNG